MACLPPQDSTSSFWLSEPSPFLLGHRTTKHLPLEADVVIVGSGITGSAVARYLHEDERAQGLQVVMLEAREACWGATGRNGGNCQPLLLDAPPDVVAFESLNWQTIRSYIEDHDVDCEWRVTQACRTVWTEELVQKSKDEFARLQEIAPDLAKRAQVITDESILEQKYRVRGAPLALIVNDVATLWPYKLVAFILEQAIKANRLNLQTKTPITKLTSIRLNDGSPRQLVVTPRGQIVARHVILATNGYTSHLLLEFGDLIVPERGIMTALLPPNQRSRLSTTHAFIGLNDSSPNHPDYLYQRPLSGVPNPNGHIMFGGGRVAATLDNMGTADDSILDEGSAAYLRREPLHLLVFDGETEGLKELKATHQWSGIWGTSRDKKPWVGPVPGREGVWLAGGYSGHGMPNGTLCGKAIVEMVLGAESGAPVDYVEDRLIRTGQLPQSYTISQERIKSCREMDEVPVQRTKDWTTNPPKYWTQGRGAIEG